MRIGILTFHRSINYGAFMQSFALTQTLQRRYPQHLIEIIDFEYERKHEKYRKPLYRFPTNIEYYIKYTRFQSSLFRLPLSKESFITDNIEPLCDFIKRNYDIVIVGSDAVWAFQNKMPLDNPYWLFGKKLDGIVKMSYAASAFTTNFDNVTINERNLIRDRLSDFTYIGVRDEATQKFVESLQLNKPVYLNNDPTLFLEPATDKSLYKRSLRNNLIFSHKKKISFMTRRMPFIDEIRETLGREYELFHFYNRDSSHDYISPKCRFLPNLSPFEWYNMYGQMALNITYYFHGACMSLINHIPTIAIDDSKTTYVSKYAQLMNDFKLNDSLFYHKKINFSVLMDRINFLLSHPEDEKIKIINAIELERKKSLSFFKELDRILLV